MESILEHLGWYRATVDSVANSSELGGVVDLGFGMHLQVRLRLAGLAAPDIDADEPAVRAAAQAACRFVDEWLAEQPDQTVVANVVRHSDHLLHAEVYAAIPPHECLNDVLIEDGYALADEEY